MADNTVNALKALYAALGGTAADVAGITTIPDMITAIAGVVTGAELPAVTADDNGKVLSVVDGAWSAKTPL